MNWDFSPVCIYAQVAPRIRERAYALGYAIALHGSMRRDLDLVAIPWIEEAADPAELVKAITEEVEGFVPRASLEGGWSVPEPTKKPHGRMVWNICWGGAPFIDLSVMPRKEVGSE